MPRRAWLLAGAAVAVRAAAALTVLVIDADGARNLRMAELLGLGRFTDALLVPYPPPPLHPFLTALTNLAVGDLLVSGVALSAVLGGLAVLPLFALTRRVWDDRVATISTALYATLPAVVDIHAEPMTEGTFMFLFFAAMAAGWSALEERSWERIVVAAGCSVLAWLTRPEGIYLVPLFLAAAVLRFSRFAPGAVAIFAAIWILLAFPYLSFIHAQTGHWQTSLSDIPAQIRDTLLGRRVPDHAAQDYAEYRAVVRHGVLLGGGGHLAAAFFGPVHFYVLGPFLVLGTLRPRPSPGQRRLFAFLLLAAIGYLIPVALSFVAATPFSSRFLLVPATLLLPLTALGLMRAAEWTRRREALPVLVGLLCLAMLVRDLRPRRADKIGLKDAGLAILKTLGPGKRVFASHRQIEFYARSEYLRPGGDPTQLDAYAFWDLDRRRLEPGLEERVRNTAAFLGEYPSPPRKDAMPVRVYLTR